MQSLVMMAKHARAQRVKTRLAKAVGPNAAASIAHVMTDHLLTGLAHCGDRRTVAAAPDDALAVMKSGFSAGDCWQWCGQGSGDLGDRMERQFRREFQEPVNTGGEPRAPLARSAPVQTLMIGSDLPTIQPEILDDAWDRLNHVNLVLGPSSDGGYWLIGLASAPHPASSGADLSETDFCTQLFRDMPWSTDRVLEQTLDRARASGLSHDVLPTAEDIDEIDALERLLERASVDPDPNHRILARNIRSAWKSVEANH